MDSKTIFIRTAKGEDEIRNKTAHLSGDFRRALLMVDGTATFAEISKRAAPSLRSVLGEMMVELYSGGFVQDKNGQAKVKPAETPKISVPPKMSVPLKKPADSGDSELDFTAAFRVPTPEILAAESAKAEAAKLQAEQTARAEAQAKRDREAAELKAKQDAEAVRLKAEQDALKAREEAARAKQQEAEAARLKAEAEAKAHAEAAARAKREIEAARLKAQQEAEAARHQAEQEATKARAEAEARAKQESEAAKAKAQQEAEAARQKAEQEAAKARDEAERAKQQAAAEAKAREEAERRAQEAARLKAEAEAKAREEAEARAKQEIEAARAKAQQEADAARQKAEQEAANARDEAERAKQLAASEAKAREEAERRAKELAEVERAKAEQEAARVRAELEAAKAQAEKDATAREQARIEAEAARIKAQQEAEEARRYAEQEAAKAREEAERAKQQAAAEAKAREDAERRAKEEAEAARATAEQEAAQARAEVMDAKAQAEAEAKARAEALEQARQEAESAKLKAQQDAESARLKAEQDAARAREEAELAKQQAAAEARARAEAEHRAKEEVETARRQAEQEAAKLREEAQQRAEQEAAAAAERLKAERESEALLMKSAQEAALAPPAIDLVKPKKDAGPARSTSATVLFFDVVGYTKQSVNKQRELKKQFNHLVSECLKLQEDGDRIILDTGDGAAIGFLHHPEDALEVAMQFRKTVMDNQHQDYPDLNVRIGIHLGPINVVKDMNGQSNMVGDGINDAQRVMSFAGTDQIFISRSYYDFISRLSDEYAELFQYRGAQKDKHGREHQVYELVDEVAPAIAEVVPQLIVAAAPAMQLEPFNFSASDVATPAPEPEVHVPVQAEATPPAVATPAPAQPPVTREPAEAKPAPEAEKPAAAVRAPSEEELKKLTEAQEKTWAQAEQRAIDNAKANAERIAQQAAHPHQEAAPAAKPEPAARVKRKPVPWGKVGAGLAAVLLVALFVIPYVLPMRGYVPQIEQLLSARLKQPVQIGSLTGRILPMPRLVLGDVSIGEKKQIRAQQAQVDFALSALFSSTKAINAIELQGVQVDGMALQQVSAWLQQIAADRQYPVGHIALSKGTLEADGIRFADIGGDVAFDPSGKLAQARLQSEGNKFALDIKAEPENKLRADIALRGSALPTLPNWVFDDLNAKGELNADGLVITEMDGHIAGGMLLGNARIDWRSGWRAEGKLEAKALTLQNLSGKLEGDMDGTASFRMQAASLSGLADTAVLDGSLSTGKGTINGMDIVETARLRSRENLPGGRTHFDELTADLTYANGAYHFKRMKLRAGVLSATGTLDVANSNLNGRIAADLALREGMGTVVLQVGGATNNPTLRVGH
ncbi:MAG TPA: AsmA-like C-terminal region-containing protein [Gallionella sp.]|nr:AsmA-like C-terminal region-containing protein [Gallionella sp.]